ncbi:MAG: VWA domain-containing protein [Bauldia sp.]
MYRAIPLAPLLLLASLAGAEAQTARSVALVLDASGSMTAKLPEGLTRIDAAKAAVADVVGKLPADVRVSLRAYGHQSATRLKDCRDTALLVPFDAAAANRGAVLDASRKVQAQGYTPITFVLKLAAEDVGREDAASHVVVLVSDGQETCGGDPCATAKALADADAKLAIHTIGLGVDAAARFQLRCIASFARGTYYDAASAGDLNRVLGQAAQQAATVKRTEIAVGQPKPGRIEIKGASQEGHPVFDALAGKRIEPVRPNTGQTVNAIMPTWPLVEVPAGIYNVGFANGLWRGIEVKAGETVVLEPGLLEIRNDDFQGRHRLLDPETGETAAELLIARNRIALIPTRFAVTFGDLVWPDVEIAPGKTTTLNPGVINLRSNKIGQYDVFTADGRHAGKVGTGADRLALPAGAYVVQLPDRKVTVDLHEGEIVGLTVQ